MRRARNRILSFLTAFAMVIGVLVAPFTSAKAADEKYDTNDGATTKTVTLHKLMMDKDILKAWDSNQVENDGYDGTQNLSELKKLDSLAGKTFDEIDNVYFALKFSKEYSDTDLAGKYVKADTNDKLTPADPLEATDNIEDAVGGLTANKSGIVFNTEGLEGEFEIDEIKEKSTYQNDGKTIVDQKAVPVEITLPLIANGGTVVNAHVYPKNTEDKPQIDKNFKKADTEKQENELEVADGFDAADNYAGIGVGADYNNSDKTKATAKAYVGKKIPYEVKTKIAAGTSYENLTWNDTMTNGLTYNKDLGDGILVESITPAAGEGQKETRTAITLNANNDYILVEDNSGFRLQLTENGLKKISDVTKADDANNQKDVEITLTYSATVNGTAIVDNPETNDIRLDYGHRPGKDLEEKPVTPKNGELNVTKNFEIGQNTEGLRLVYTLKQGSEVKASVTLDNTITNKTIDLGNGIKFVADKTAFNGKFTGLGNETTGWTISERVAGYNPVYVDDNENGTVTITNKKDNDNPPPLNPTEPKVVVGGKKFVKTDNKDAKAGDFERLAGAKFVIKNSDKKYLAAKSQDTLESEAGELVNAKKALNTAVKNYNERQDDKSVDHLKSAIDSAQVTYNEAFKKASVRYEWVDAPTDENAVDNRVILASNSKGQFSIEGLEYGSYTLEEIEAPKGFAKLSDQKFEIAKGEETDVDIKYEESINTEANDKESSTTAKNDSKQIKNKKVTIPQTGGIGSLIFIIAGLAIMGIAFTAMKKRNSVEKHNL